MPTYLLRWIVGGVIALAGAAMVSTLWTSPSAEDASVGGVRRALSSLYGLAWADGKTFTLSRLPYEIGPHNRRYALKPTREVVAEALAAGMAVVVTTDYRYMSVTTPDAADLMHGSQSEYNPGSARWVRVY